MKIQKQALWCIIFTLSVILLVIVPKRCENKENGANPVYIRDTLVSVIWDTVMLDHYETVVLPLTDTLLYKDSVRVVDSVKVELPVYRYAYDTAIFTDTTELDLSVRVSGFGVSLDTLAYLFHYTPKATISKERRFGVFVGPMIGIGKDGLCAGIGVGIGLKLGRR